MFNLFLIAASAASPVAGDVDQKLLGKDDIRYAELLSRMGYDDLAQEIYDAYGRVHGNTAAAAGALVDAGWNQARREPDLQKRWDRFNALLEERQAFITSKAGSPEAQAAMEQLPDNYREVGELTTLMLEKEEDAARAKELRDRGSKMFEKAVDLLKARCEELAPQVEEDEAKNPDNLNEELRQDYMFARYGLARTLYFHSLALEKGFARQSRLESALKELADIQLAYGGELLEYEACIWEGLCRKELDDVDGAIDAYDAAIRLRELWEKAGPVYRIDMQPACDIISLAVHQKMLALASKGDHAGAAATARDFFTSIPDPERAARGLAVLSAEADAYQALGDRKSLEATARFMIEVDPNGEGGNRGRELIGDQGPAMAADDKLKLAMSAESRNDIDKAIELYQEVLTDARGNAELGVAADDALGAQAGFRLGSAYWRKLAFHEAVTAWDATADRFQKGKDAVECLWSAIEGYTELQKQEQVQYYRTRARERMQELVTRYPTHSYASMTSINEGKQIDADGDYPRAADAFLRITPGSAGYEEGIYRAGTSWLRQARKLKQEGKTADFKSAVARAEELLKKAQPALEEAARKTLEIATQDKMRGFSFAARVNLADLYLLEGVDRPDEVLPLFANVENDYPDDAPKINAARTRRLQALQKAGKLDDAIELLDSLLRDDPNAPGLDKSAAALARALDTRASEVLKKNPTTRDADDTLRKAARLYVLSMQSQLSGNEALRLGEIEPIANRLFALALHFNRVPNEVKSFVDWNGQLVESDLFEQAQAAYEQVIALTPSYRAMITLAQTQGYLRRWTEAAKVYADLFEREKLADLNTRQLNSGMVSAKPELLSALLEWGVCERESGSKDNDTTRLSRASSIFETLVQGTAPASKMWWQSKYYQLRTLVDRGEYGFAGIGMRDIERGYPDFDENKFGLKERMTKLRDEIKSKDTK